jgi:shikimate kinase/3-dehydroquinate synthase
MPNFATGRRAKVVARSPSEPPLDRPHVAIVGFMGAGKTSIGRLVAERAGLDFVDVDEMIAKQAGQSIAEIFRDHGEVGFRARERAAIRELLSREKPTVIATGGGTFVDPSVRNWIVRAARTIFLRVSPDVLVARLHAGEARHRRPLLSGPDPDATVRRLLNERTPAYEQCDFAIAADGRSKDEIAEEILHVLRLGSEANRTVRRHVVDEGSRPEAKTAKALDSRLAVRAAQGDYVVEVHAEAGDWIARGITQVCQGARIGIISDATVAPLHARLLARDLTALGKRVTVCTFAPGEDQKTLATVTDLYDRLLTAGFDRSDAIVGIGGGVVGDVAGFVAATLLRGVAYVQVPTTTLAAVDASVGGKNGVNTSHGKNLVGTFHAPKAVFVAAAHLATQHRRVHASGLVEAVKIAATLDADFFTLLSRSIAKILDADGEALTPVLRRAIFLKAQIVSRDEHEQGERAVLNFGHTIGHAIERGEQYRLLHGEAVALGMMAELLWAESRGFSHAVSGPVRDLLTALELQTDFSKVRIDLDALRLDKKRDADNVRLPVVPQLGSCVIHSVPVADLITYFGKK